MELQRWRDRRGLAFRIQPKHWPFDPKLADRVAIAIQASHGDPDPFLRRAFAAVWEEERDLGDPATVAALAREAGFDPEPLLDRARGSTTEAIYALNLENAIAADVFGSPAYVLDGEVFWGQDRLDLLDDALTSGRPAYRPDTAS